MSKYMVLLYSRENAGKLQRDLPPAPEGWAPSAPEGWAYVSKESDDPNELSAFVRAYSVGAGALGASAEQLVTETGQADPGSKRTTRADQSGSSNAESGRLKLTVNLPERDMAILRQIAAKRGMSLTDAVRRAIAMEQFIEEVESQGGKLLVEQPDHTIRQLVLR